MFYSEKFLVGDTEFWENANMEFSDLEKEFSDETYREFIKTTCDRSVQDTSQNHFRSTNLKSKPIVKQAAFPAPRDWI